MATSGPRDRIRDEGAVNEWRRPASEFRPNRLRDGLLARPPDSQAQRWRTCRDDALSPGLKSGGSSGTPDPCEASESPSGSQNARSGFPYATVWELNE